MNSFIAMHWSSHKSLVNEIKADEMRFDLVATEKKNHLRHTVTKNTIKSEAD